MMIYDLTQKRKHLDTEGPSSSRSLNDDVDISSELSPCRSKRKKSHDSSTSERNAGHTYTKNHVGENARAHFGDVYSRVFNYSAVPPEDPWARFLESLEFDGMEHRLASINTAYAKTCDWMFDTPEFSQWRDTALQDSNCGILSIRGHPGAGKSTLMKCIYEHFKMCRPEHTVISFFFNARGEPLENAIEGMYRSMLSQILEMFPRLRTALAAPRLPRVWTANLLKDLLRQAVLCLQGESLIWIVDGLDECNDQQELRPAVYFLRNLAESSQHLQMSFKICLASRHHLSVHIPFSQEIVVESLEAHAKGIQTYLSDNLIVSPEAMKERLQHSIQQQSKGIFQWVILIVDLLNEKSKSGATRTQLEDTLRKIPDNLNNLFSSLCYEGASDKYFLLALEWVLFAKRRLTVQELYFGIRSSAGELSTTVWDRDEADLESMGRFILHAGRGMVELSAERYQKQHVQFIHESVREYLLGGGLAGLSSCLPSNIKAAGHMKLANSILAYVQLVLDQDVDVEIISCAPDEDFLRKDDIPLFEYAWDCMFSHMEEAYVGGFFDLNCLEHLPLKGFIDAACYLGVLFERPRCLENLVYFLLNGGHIALVEALLRSHINSRSTTNDDQKANDLVDGPHIDSSPDWDTYDLAEMPLRKDHFGSPLSLALFLNETSIVQLLLDCGADVICHDKWYNHPLNVAVRWTEKQVVRLLLDHKADVNVKAPLRKTPLSTAVCEGELETVQLLLDRGADINLEDGCGESPLTCAVSGDKREILQILLEQGADINLTDESRETPLTLAVSRGRTEIVQLLLEHGADIHLKDRWGEDPLTLAVSRGKIEIVQLLLGRGADTEVKGATGHNPFSRATRIDRMEILRLLLRYRADVNIHLHTRYNPLSSAAYNDNLDAIQLLLDHGANINMSNGPHGNALSVAAHRCRLAGVELLLQRGADVNLCAAESHSPLMLAARAGRRDIVRLLLDWSAKIILVRPGMRDDYLSDETINQDIMDELLDYGKRAGIEIQEYMFGETIDQDIMHSLLDHGEHAGIEIQDLSSCWTQAARRCDVKTMRRLVELGADPNSRDGNGRTALHMIVDDVSVWDWIEANFRKGRLNRDRDRASALRALLDLGADVNAVGGDFSSVLIAASSRGSLHEVQLFLNSGADPNVCSPVHGTPIDAARAAGHTEICRELEKSLKRGRIERGEQNELQMWTSIMGGAAFTRVGHALLGITTSLRDKFGL
jgi:ankyrin repeat protein